MPFTLVKRPSDNATSGLRLISWNTFCQFCGKTISLDYPLVIFSVQQASCIGAAPFECGDNAFSFAQFRLRAPGILDAAQISFLAQFYPALFKLPGWGQSTSLLRRCLASMLLDFPQSWSNPSLFLAGFIEENLDDITRYPGDLEADFFSFLGEVQERAKRIRLNVEIKFD
jgi:hypothetical protein